MSDLDKNQLLEKLIPRLREYKFMPGGEDGVYIIDDDYVVKMYYDDSIDPDRFNWFCKELCDYTQFDRRMPKVYAWKDVKTQKNNGEISHEYYILEERIRGNNLIVNMNLSYHIFKDLGLSKEEYNYILDHKDERETDFRILFEIFLKTYLDMVDFMANRPDYELQKIVETGYDSAVKLQYGFPDVHAGNVMLTDKSIYLLDNSILKSYLPKKSGVYSKEFVYELVTMFTFFARSCHGYGKKFLKEKNFEKLYKDISEASIETLDRMIDSMNKLYSNPQDVLGDFYRHILDKELGDTFGEKASSDILTKIH